jgi:hypothetical protein
MIPRLLLTAVSGWLLVLLLALTVRLAYRHRLRWHYWVGYSIAGLTLVHSWVPMTPALAGRAHKAGLEIATLAFLLVLIETGLGLWLRRRAAPERAALRRIHFWVMASLSALAAVHIGLDSALLGTFRP